MEYLIATLLLGLPAALIGVILYKKFKVPVKECPVVINLNKAKKKKSKKSKK